MERLMRMILMCVADVDDRDPHVQKDPMQWPLVTEVGDIVRADVKRLLRDVGYMTNVEVVYLPEPFSGD